MKQTVVCAMLLYNLVFVVTCYAAEAPGEPLEINKDTVEYQFEFDRQERLEKQRVNPLNEVNEFTTDGCSGGLSVGWNYLAHTLETFKQDHGVQPPWETCCVEHDRIYHTAGGRTMTAAESYELRMEADRELRTCVQQTGHVRVAELGEIYGMSTEDVTGFYDVIAGLMYRAVRIGGIPCSGLPWRWGYGWPACE
jgi:hypothetical protein